MASSEETAPVSIPTPESPLVQEYLTCFGEIARVVSAAGDVPPELWDRIRESWAAMSAEEREEVERRIGEGKR